jgi:hypothetical protein
VHTACMYHHINHVQFFFRMSVTRICALCSYPVPVLHFACLSTCSCNKIQERIYGGVFNPCQCGASSKAAERPAVALWEMR